MSHQAMPLCRYRGALLLTTKLRKATGWLDELKDEGIR